MSTVKILPIIPHMDDATSFYRAMGPLSELFRKNQIHLTMTNEVKWATSCLCDVMFLQRPFRALDIVAAKRGSVWGRKLWVDYDDDLFAVPAHNKANDVYNNPDTQKCVAEMVAMADIVTVSTWALKQKYDDIRAKIDKRPCLVIPNALHDDMAMKRKKVRTLNHNLVMWRGSDTHEGDLLSVLNPLAETFHQRKDWMIHFLGYSPLWMQRSFRPTQAIGTKGLDIMDFHDHIIQIEPAICVVPLEGGPFNDAKSNIAWIEATMSHAMVIAPDMREWRMPGVTNYKDPEHFGQILNWAMDLHQDQRNELVEKSWQHIQDHLLLSKVNEARISVLKDLTNGENNAKDYISYLADGDAIDGGRSADLHSKTIS